MIDNEERREVASKLRETMLTEGAADVEIAMGLDPAVAARFVAIPNLVGALNFNKAIVSIRELTDRLADLIEPDPERTCRIRQHGTLGDCYPSFMCWSCSECNFGWHHSINDKQFSYCPNCGAKVINNAD